MQSGLCLVDIKAFHVKSGLRPVDIRVVHVKSRPSLVGPEMYFVQDDSQTLDVFQGWLIKHVAHCYLYSIHDATPIAWIYVLR